MRAVAITRFGPPEVLEVVDVPIPRPDDGEVSIDVAYAAVGFIDVLFRRGDLPELVETPFVPGLEVAGTIRELGAGVTGLVVGEPVVTLSRPSAGGYAEVAVAAATGTVPLRGSGGRVLDPAEAVATVPNTVTALSALGGAAHLAVGESVLVHGATGGLASVFGGVALALGAVGVAGTVGDEAKVAAARRLHFDDVFLASDVASLQRHFDVIVDAVGGDARTASVALLRSGGRLLVMGNASGAADVPISGNEMWLANTSVVGFNVGGLLAADPERVTGMVDHAVQLIADGRVDIPVEILALEQVADAHRRLEARAVSGKLVLEL